MPKVSKEEVSTNRANFLHYLRQSLHKGAIASDEQGCPVPPEATGVCVTALMLTMFEDYGGVWSQLNYRKALGLTVKECHLIQAMNDSALTFPEIAGKYEHVLYTCVSGV